MKKNYLLLIFAFGFLFVSCTSNQNPALNRKYIKYVDPFIGTGGHGHVFPGATTPFGMVQVSPNNGISGWDWCSGYHISSNQFAGFTHMSLSGTGIGDMTDILITPTTKTVTSDTVGAGKDFTKRYYSSYNHKNEKASPGYYSVKLDNGITTELTASSRTAFHKYVSKSNNISIIIRVFVSPSRS